MPKDVMRFAAMPDSPGRTARRPAGQGVPARSEIDAPVSDWAQTRHQVFA